MSKQADPNLVARAIDQIDRSRLVQLTVDLTNIPSPTGYEGDMARAVREVLAGAGFDATLQPIGDERYNAIGRLQGQGGGKSLMFNGHLDTSFGPEQAHRGKGGQRFGSAASRIQFAPGPAATPPRTPTRGPAEPGA